MEHCSGVYTIQHVESGKKYIGSARLFRRRFAQHRTALRGGYHQNKHLQAVWNKHGETAFKFSVTLVCSPEDMQDYEQLLIDGFQPEYNQSKSAYSGIPVGATCSDDHKRKVGAASVKAWAQADYREKVTAAIRQSMTADEKIKRVERSRRLWANPDYREKAVASRKGKAYSAGYVCTPEQVLNRKRAARISHIKRKHGDSWAVEYAKWYPEFAGDVDGK
jgi:group I intron endonuclease